MNTKSITKWMAGAALAGAMLFTAPHKAEAQRVGFGISIGTPAPVYYGPSYVAPAPVYPYPAYYGPAYGYYGYYGHPYYGGYRGYYGHPYYGGYRGGGAFRGGHRR